MIQTVPHFKAADDLESICTALNDVGAVIIDDFLDAGLLARFNAELDTVLADVPDGRKLSNEMYEYFFGAHTQHISGVAAHSQVFAEEILCHPLYEQVCDKILLPFCANYRLNVAHVLDRGPGSEQQFFHRDEDVWAHLPKPHPTIQLASIIALQDFTEANGATRIAPGSHRWERDRECDFDDVVSAEMPAGAAVFYLGAVFHGGGPNTTSDQRRRGMHLSFNVGWLRTEENNYLVVPPEKARALPKRAQQLLGYEVHDGIDAGGGTLGLLNTNNPMDLLARGEL